ncbi:cysteine hydrolase family protein [Desulfomicrobium escambiense]|uniref:cysteine hydrolase family protein n=1 Tax=Desulfomicrobium escambiense TaxID=29503 RepID=UPI00040369AB|nr:isochorismatase family cysteine hydrolase [Desulfomicrobium escambiense]
MNEALLIIDMQNDFAVPGGTCEVPGAHATIPAIRRVLLRFRELGLPVFHVVREYRADGSDVEITRLAALKEKDMVVPGTPGVRIVPGLEPEAGEYRIVKPRFSAFMFTELDLILRRKGITHLAVTGTQLPFCLRATLFDGLCLGYRMTLITDASSSRTEEIHHANIRDIRDAGMDCVSVDEYLRGLAAGAQAPS